MDRILGWAFTLIISVGVLQHHVLPELQADVDNAVHAINTATVTE